MVSARILQNGISSLLEACLQKKATCPILIIVADNQSFAIKPIKPTTNSHVVKFPETQFRLKGFGHLFSKRCKEKEKAAVARMAKALFLKGAKTKVFGRLFEQVQTIYK